MSENTGTFKLGLGVLGKLPPIKTRKRNPLAHIYPQMDGSYKFKAIMHEDALGIKSTRQSFKAVVTVVPVSNIKSYDNIASGVLALLSCLITLLVCTFYVDDKMISTVAMVSQLVIMLAYLVYSIIKNKEIKHASDTDFIH